MSWSFFFNLFLERALQKPQRDPIIYHNTPEIKSHVDEKHKLLVFVQKGLEICLLFKQSIKEVNVNRVKKRAQIYTKRS